METRALVKKKKAVWRELSYDLRTALDILDISKHLTD
jgi:hypothetical protein